MYRNKPYPIHQENGSPGLYDVEVSVPKEVVQKGSDEPMTVVELKRMPAEEYAKILALPKSEDYQLRDMLAAGKMPEMVNVSGMLDSSDPMDLSNAGVEDQLFDNLERMAPKQAAPVATEPVATEPVEPSNPE